MFVLWSQRNAKNQAECIKVSGLFVLGVFSVLVVAWIGHNRLTNESRWMLYRTRQSYNQRIRSALINGFNADNIMEHNVNLTRLPHLAGTSNNDKVADYIHDYWTEIGLKNVHFAEYSVLLNYPDYDRPNTVTLKDRQTGQIKFQTKGSSKVILPEEQGDPGAGIRFNAYSATGTVQGQLVYCNYGRPSDFAVLRRLGIDVAEKIALIRYGQSFRGGKVMEAEKNGAIGVVLFSDPADSTLKGRKTYPDTVYMPESGVQRGTLKNGEGDPLTPNYPAKNYTFRSETIESARSRHWIPSIPVTPISYGDVRYFLKALGGPLAPSSWQGGLPLRYHLGPQLSNGRRRRPQQQTAESNHSTIVGDSLIVELSVQGEFVQRRIRNVIGQIDGSREPDRYVIVGNHYDAWTYGSIDPNSGTATMMEMSRVFLDEMTKLDWTPSRTIIFIAWDAEEYGLIGSTEWVEEFSWILSKRAVAYINLDLIPGNQTLKVSSVPSLYQAAIRAAQAVPNPNPDEIKSCRQSLYDSWIHYFPSKSSPWNLAIPETPIPAEGSDQGPFLNFNTVPVMDFIFSNTSSDSSGGLYPLYHTLYETRYLPVHLMDPDGFRIHVATGQFWAEVVRQLADNDLLPLNATDLSEFIGHNYGELTGKMQKKKPKLPVAVWQQTTHLDEAIKSLGSRIQHLQSMSDTYRINERLMSMEGCFRAVSVTSRSQISKTPPKPRHVLYGASATNSYGTVVFPNVVDALERWNGTNSDLLISALSQLQYAVECLSTVAESI